MQPNKDRFSVSWSRQNKRFNYFPNSWTINVRRVKPVHAKPTVYYHALVLYFFNEQPNIFDLATHNQPREQRLTGVVDQQNNSR